MPKFELRASKNKLIPCAVVAALFLIHFLHAPIVPVAVGCVLALLVLTLRLQRENAKTSTAARKETTEAHGQAQIHTGHRNNLLDDAPTQP